MIFFSRTLLLFITCLALCSESQAGWVCGSHDDCNPGQKTSTVSQTGDPSKGSSIRINPAAVPLEVNYGLEAILYKSEFDFVFVKGLGRVGAALSPSNSEETFFGPPGFELPESFLKRKQDGAKYKSSKLTLATAFNAYDNKSSGLHRVALNLGVMGKYDRTTSTVTFGVGANGVLGPFTFGYSTYGDQTQLNYEAYGLSPNPIIRYAVETYSAGIFLESFIFDYSVLRLITTEESTVNMMTASLLLGKSIITASQRVESSDRVAYDTVKLNLKNEKSKTETFAGVQYRVVPTVMLGVFYNFYLLHDISLGATWFF